MKKAFKADMVQIADTNASVNKSLDFLNVGVNADMLKRDTQIPDALNAILAQKLNRGIGELQK